MKNVDSNYNLRVKDVNFMTHEEISALKQKEIAEINKNNEDNEYIDLFGCSGKLTVKDFKLIKLIGKGSFGKVCLFCAINRIHCCCCCFSPGISCFKQSWF